MYRMVQDVQDGPGCTEGCSASYLFLLTKRGFFRDPLHQIRNLAADQDGPGSTEGCSASYLILLTKRGFFRETLGQIRNLLQTADSTSCRLVSCDLENTGQRTGARVLVTKKTSKRRNSFIS